MKDPLWDVISGEIQTKEYINQFVTEFEVLLKKYNCRIVDTDENDCVYFEAGCFDQYEFVTIGGRYIMVRPIGSIHGL